MPVKYQESSRTLAINYKITDDVLRQYRTADGQNFRPTNVMVSINFGTGEASVDLEGPVVRADGSESVFCGSKFINLGDYADVSDRDELIRTLVDATANANYLD